jgi:hypothetical protein
MKEYTKYKRGSEWRKWDLHIHTPETKKNDQFEGSTISEKWDKYIETINNSTEEIDVIGITDYFSIINYFKLKEFIISGKITKKFELVLPNIEIRVLPVTGSAIAINLHCIFNPAIDGEIESRFLGKLKFTNSKSSYSATRDELIRFGRDHVNNPGLDAEQAYKKGVEQYVISLDSLQLLFKNDPALRENTIIVVSNKSNDGASGIIKHEDFFINKDESQLDATRQSFYQFSDAVFSPNEKDRIYFVGRSIDNEKTVIRKCGTLKPCFHGSDAHSNEKVFKPDENRFCWIKADPTFEGLKQTLYEPEDRVKIQALKPDVKNERYIVSELEFIDDGSLFGNRKILLNENLNAIIGGKSSGKSLLLFSAAKSIDPDQVDKSSKKLGFGGYKFEKEFDFQVTWKNDDVDKLSELNPSMKLHKITYIPQLYINYLAEKNNKEELNALIKNILLQDSGFKDFYEQNIKSIEAITNDIENLLNEYLRIRESALEKGRMLKEIGYPETINKNIEKINTEIAKGQKATNLSEQEFKDYNALLADKTEQEKFLNKISIKEKILNKILDEVKGAKQKLTGDVATSGDFYFKGQINHLLAEITEITEDVEKIVRQIEIDFDSLIAHLERSILDLDIESKVKIENGKLILINKKIEPYTIKLSGQKELQKLTLLLESEKMKSMQSLTLNKQFNELMSEYENIRKRKTLLLKKRFECYKEIEKRINESMNLIGTEISLKCTLNYKQDDFPLYHQTNKASISGEHIFNSFFREGFVQYDLVPDFYSNFLRVVEDKLYYNKENYIPLKLRTELQEVLRGLVKDSFEIDFSVTYKEDELLNMSPGKKGTVLLILFLQISTSEFPIFIDQPEDNLDNRTIYDLLCKMIKEKKKERQIIIVSHNANLVVATDSENIIVANQKGQGQDSCDGEKASQFEYINGALEHSFAKNSKISSILLCQGIKEHVCDILEGGDEAFKQRERKYSIKL